MGTSDRRRPLYFPSGGVDEATTIPPFGTGIPSVTKSAYTIVGGQRTVSTTTIWPYLVKARALYKGTKLTFKNIDVGSNFFTSNITCSEPEARSYIRRHNAYTTSEWTGTCYAFTPNSTPGTLQAPLTVSEQQTLMAYGTTAIARCIPTNPVAGLANFLGELKRDGLPSLPGEDMRKAVERNRLLQGVASENLNLQFAIRPVISDIRSFAEVVKTHDKVIRQYLRDSGKNIKRRYRFPTETSTESSTVSTNYLPTGVPSKYFASGGTLTLETVTTVDRWFTGEFCYYLSLDDNLMGQLQNYLSKADRLLGVKPDPELIWNLAPWSWALDWFSNAGDVFHNVSAFLSDGLVMRRAYVMEQKTITSTYRLSGYTLASGSVGPTSPLTQTFRSTRKVRMRASPFGFGKLITDLSPRQLAIIASLGILQSGGKAK